MIKREYSLKAKRFAFQANNMSSSLITRIFVYLSLMTTSTYMSKLKHIENYKNFSQYFIKKGKKATAEKIFKSGLIF